MFAWDPRAQGLGWNPFLFFFFFFHFWPPLGIWNSCARDEIPEPSYSLDLSHSCSNARSPTHRARPEMKPLFQSSQDTADPIVPQWKLQTLFLGPGAPETRLQLQIFPGFPSRQEQEASPPPPRPENVTKMLPRDHSGKQSPPESSLRVRCAEAGLGAAGHPGLLQNSPKAAQPPWESLIPSMNRPGRAAPARPEAQVPAPSCHPGALCSQWFPGKPANTMQMGCIFRKASSPLSPTFSSILSDVGTLHTQPSIQAGS